MNLTSINQMLWVNLISVSSTETLSGLIKKTLMEHKESDIIDMLNVLVSTDISKEKLHSVIDSVEDCYVEGCSVDLAPYLSVLYHKNGIEYLSRYYLGLITEVTEEIKNHIESLVELYTCESDVEYAINSISNYDFCREYQYQGLQKEYSVHSFSKTIGKNATILKTPYGAILFDCGAACGVDTTDVISEIEMLEFFKSIDISPDDLLAVLISHAHLDHYGSITTLINLGIEMSKIYIEDDTKALIKQVAVGIPSMEAAFPVNAFFTPFQRVKITAFSNGHILGSKGYVVSFDELNIVYTGDFCIHNQKTVPGLDVDFFRRNSAILKYGVDCLITETTYGRKEAPIKYDDVAKILLHFVETLTRNGYKIFIPSFAIGRSQEIALLLNESHSVLIDGLAAKISRIYEEIAGLKIFNNRTRYNDNFDDDKEDNFDCNDIIIASSGMLAQNSTSYNYVHSFLKSDRKIAIIKTGYIGSESYGNEILRIWQGRENRLFDISLSAHADFNEILQLVYQLKPNHIVCIHGDGLKDLFNVEEQVAYDDSANRDCGENNFTNEPNQDDSGEINDSYDDIVEDTSDDIDEDVDDIEKEYSNAVKIIDLKVLDEVMMEPQEPLMSMIQKFLELYRHTEKSSRNAPRSRENKFLCDAYYNLYSYVRLHKKYSGLYHDLYLTGAKKKKIYSYLSYLLYLVKKREEEIGEFAHNVEAQQMVQNKEPQWNETCKLHVYKNQNVCKEKNHLIAKVVVELLGKNNNIVKLNANYCKDCQKFYIEYTDYTDYLKKNSILIGNIELEEEPQHLFSDVNLAEASPLKLCGYSVNQQDGYSKETRQYIISTIIDKGIMSKAEVLRYLEYFISINGKRRGNQVALIKWREDRDFVLNYKGK